MWAHSLSRVMENDDSEIRRIDKKDNREVNKEDDDESE
jgi:hypothetical protein